MKASLKLMLACVASLTVMLTTGCTSIGAKVSGGSVPMGAVSTTATYDVIGPAKGSASGATLLGFIPIGGGAVKKRGVIASGLPYQRPLPPVEAEAIYNAIESVPGADALIAPRWNVKVSNYLIYQEKTVTVQAKAIRYNSSGQ